MDIHCVLWVHDRRDRFERNAKIDVLSVRDPALDASGEIGGSPNPAAFHPKGIVVLPAREMDPVESRTDVKTFGSRQTQHGFPKVRFQTIKDRFAPARRDTAGEASDDAPDAIALTANFLDESYHFSGRVGIGTAHDIRFDGFGGHRGAVDRGDNIVGLLDVSQDLDAEAFPQ